MIPQTKNTKGYKKRISRAGVRVFGTPGRSITSTTIAGGIQEDRENGGV